MIQTQNLLKYAISTYSDLILHQQPSITSPKGVHQWRHIIKFIDSKVFVVYYAITHPFHLCGVQNGKNLGKNMNSYKTEDIIVIILLTYCNTVYLEVMYTLREREREREREKERKGERIKVSTK